MPNKPINPGQLYNAVHFGFSHAVESRGQRTLHLAGQVAWDPECNVVGPNDLAAQTRQALANLKAVLAEAGAGPEHVVRLRTYIVDHKPEKLGVVLPEIGAFYDGATPAANTLIGVAALAMPEFLIEIEATAVLD